MRKDLIRAWAVVCKTGEVCDGGEGKLIMMSRDAAQQWKRELDEYEEGCGPHRIAELIESIRKTT